jgi:hypothetical protein
VCYPRAILGGQYRLMFNGTDYGYRPESLTNEASQTFLNQRLRTWMPTASRSAGASNYRSPFFDYRAILRAFTTV